MSENVCLWHDGNEELAAWVVWQKPFGTLDYACRPECELQFSAAIFQWAEARGMAFCCVMARDQDTLRRDFLAQFGYHPLGRSHIRMECSLRDSLPVPVLPDGLTLRSLAGAAEAEAYTALHRAAFGSENMTAEWRRRTLEAAEYVPALDLVAVAPNGRLAAFCIGWLDPAPLEGVRWAQVEPLGVHPDFQRLGLGKAILTESLRQMQAHGATVALVSADSSEEGQRVYRAAGFQPVTEERAYGREFAPRG